MHRVGFKNNDGVPYTAIKNISDLIKKPLLKSGSGTIWQSASSEKEGLKKNQWWFVRTTAIKFITSNVITVLWSISMFRVQKIKNNIKTLYLSIIQLVYLALNIYICSTKPTVRSFPKVKIPIRGTIHRHNLHPILKS